jgi:hypothetical protein
MWNIINLKYYRNMDSTLLKQLKESKELKEVIGNVYQSKNRI